MKAVARQRAQRQKGPRTKMLLSTMGTMGHLNRISLGVHICAGATATRDPRKKMKKEAPEAEIAAGGIPAESVDLIDLRDRGGHPTLVGVGHAAAIALSILMGDWCIQRA